MLTRKKTLFDRILLIPLFISLFGVLVITIDVGFEHKWHWNRFFGNVYTTVIAVGILMYIQRLAFKKLRTTGKALFLDTIITGLFCLVLWADLAPTPTGMLAFLDHKFWVFGTVIWTFFREFGANSFSVRRSLVNPAQLFVLSFLVIILAGSLLLSLPKATVNGITFLQALFTSTSAVCVTGLIVVDTATFFTPLGQTIILLLIQIGGLGIMTFASYFSYFFRGGSSFSDHMLVSELNNNEKLGEVFSTVKKILLVTVSFEGIGALLVFYSLDRTVIPDYNDRVFFSIFHAVSAFCNAGFSTLTNSLYELPFRFNYSLHLVIAGLIVLGGIGFPIMFNLWSWLKSRLISVFKRLTKKERHTFSPWVLNVNSRLILYTTLWINVAGFLLFFLFEYQNSLASHSFSGKLVTAFFGSVTNRTAGFNTVDVAALALPTTLIGIFFMWIGASPASTGGGIKTSTFAISMLNIWNLARGQRRIEIFGREISSYSVDRAFAIIMVSNLAICVSVFGLVLLDGHLGILNIIFECVSAYCTVGLSRGITASLSPGSQTMLILTMFAGRVGMFTMLVTFLKQVNYTQYQYPAEDILLN